MHECVDGGPQAGSVTSPPIQAATAQQGVVQGAETLGGVGHLNLWHLADTHIQSDLHQSDFYITEELRVKRFAQGTSNDSLGTGI